MSMITSQQTLASDPGAQTSRRLDGQTVVEMPVPRPGAGELLLEVRAAGVNPVGPVRAGLPELAATLGREVAGVVAAVGPDVDGFSVGDAVLGPVAPGSTGLAEHTLVRAAEAVTKPEEISFTDAAVIALTAAAAYDGTHQVELEPGQTLLVLGVGTGVGLMAAQIGKVHQFRVIGTGAESERGVVETTGATLVPNGPGLAARVREAAPDGVDLVLDLVGGDTLRAVTGLVPGAERIISADPVAITTGGVTALGRTAAAVEKITGVVQYGLVDPHVTATYPLERAGEALAAVTGPVTGTVVVEMRPA